MDNVLILANDTTYTFNLRYEIIDALSKENYKIHIVAQEEQWTEELRQMGCKIHPIVVNRHGKNPISDIRLTWNYLKILSKVKPIAVLSYNIKPNVYGGIACALKKYRFLPNITGLGGAVLHPGLTQKLTILLYQIGLRKAECVFFQNQSNLEFMNKHHMLPKSVKTCVLPGSGVSLEKNCYMPFPDENRPIRFLFIGRIMRDKGINELLEAAHIIKTYQPTAEIYIIGGYDENYKSVLNRAQNEGLITYLGIRNDVHAQIADAHCVVLPSYHEGMANTLLEAAAAGRPVIATCIPGCKETFDEGVTGLGCLVGNAENLADAMIRFINIPYQDKVKMGELGHIKMVQEFDRKIVVNQYIKKLRGE